MKEVFFNELSTRRLCFNTVDEEQKMGCFLRTFAALQKEGFKKVCFAEYIDRICLSPNTTIYDYCKKHQRDSYTLLLLHNVSYPYIKSNTPEEDDYIEKDIKLYIKGRRIHSEGFTAAFLNHSVCIAFCNNIFGNQLAYNLIVTEKGKNDCKVQCLCLTSEKHVDEQQYRKWLLENGYDSIPECDLEISDKSIHLSPDHHGYNELQTFSRKIVKDRYVIGVLNSIDQKSNEKDFLRAYRGEGVIDIVLYKSARGLALKLKTTARNEYEATLIARHIEKHYY